jgi:hypothetical protein
LYWSQCNSNKTGIAEGRLRTHEVTCSFVLGCEDCSETMVVIGADTFIAKHVAAQSELAALREELAQAAHMRTFWAESAAELDKRLADAERRNSILEGEIVAALPGVRFMDLPDGGSPTLAEQVKRMSGALATAERRYQGLQKLTPYRFKKMQEASVTDGGDVMYFHSDKFDALMDAELNKPEEAKS